MSGMSLFLVMTDPYHDNNWIVGLYETMETAKVAAESYWHGARYKEEVGIWPIGVGDFDHSYPYTDAPYTFNGGRWAERDSDDS